MSTDSLPPIVPHMQAETGFEETIAPLRVSGFIALLLGLLSASALLGSSMLLIPIAAFAFGLFALRKHSGPTPVGIRPAMAGMILAAGFGACGLFIPWMKTAVLGSQAKQFSRDYIELLAQDEVEYAMEMCKDYVNRFPKDMNLKEHYTRGEDSQRRLDEFRDSSPLVSIQKRGRNADWILDRPINVYHLYGDERAEVVWADPARKTRLRVILIYKVDSDGDGQWHVDTCQPYRERIVAPAVL